MRIGVLSDTHLKLGRNLPIQVWEGIKDVELILHAGDILKPDLLEELNLIAPTYAVRGNCDGWDLIDLPLSRIIDLKGVKIGLTHGHLGPGATTPDRAFKQFESSSVNIIIFGHSHIPYKESRGEILLFNPGSPTDKRRETQFSYGIITIKDKAMSAEHYYY